jgi:hypothetical protein
MLLLFHQGKPVGVIGGGDDEYEDAPIMRLCVINILYK